MDCIRAREIVSEAFDRGIAATPLAAEAREHCRGCDECRAFVEGLSTLAMIAPPTAPASLVDDIVTRARKMAEAGVPPQVVRAAKPDEPAEAEPDQEAPAVKRPRPAAWWLQRAGIAAAAAVFLVLAVSISVQGFRTLGGKGGQGTAMSADSSSPQAAKVPYGGAGAAVPESGGAQSQRRLGAETDGLAAAPAASGPRYVAFDGEAYACLGERQPEEESLEQIGTLTSSLDTSDSPVSRDVWRSKADADLIFVRTPAATATSPSFFAFKRVERERQGKAYALSADASLTTFGVWPALPSSFTTPTASDGYPAFVSAGRDDTGLEVFAPQGESADEGFAIGPATASADPAGGNPNWTWWLPKKGAR